MHILFLNLSDHGGASAKSIAALRRKYPSYSGYNPFRWLFDDNSVEEIDLISLWSMDRSSFDFWSQVLAIALKASVADKILLSIHGHADDTTCGYIERFGMSSKRVNFRDLAQFLLLLLPNQSERFHLALITCHAARAQNFRKDHTGPLTALDVKSSFAYRFYKEICTQRHVLMTARTGSVSHSEHDGRSLVQTEAGVLCEVDLQALQESKEIERLNRAYEGLKEREFERYGHIRDFLRRQALIENELERGRTDWSMASFEDRIILAYQQAKRRINRLTRLQNEERGKYGKFIYEYDRSNLVMTVLRKYPKPSAILYQGGL